MTSRLFSLAIRCRARAVALYNADDAGGVQAPDDGAGDWQPEEAGALTLAKLCSQYPQEYPPDAGNYPELVAQWG